MSRSVIETVLGGFVLIGALVFFIFSYSKGDAGSVSGYQLSANFSKIGGLKSGDPVLVSGVKVGQIANVMLDPTTYLAKVTMDIDSNIQVPDDSAATISSQSLLGGMALAIEPGGSEDMIKAGGEIGYTQAPQNLEELLGKFIFSMQDKKEDGKAGEEKAVAPVAPSLENNVEKSPEASPAPKTEAAPAADVLETPESP